jgi:hypothetical protein
LGVLRGAPRRSGFICSGRRGPAQGGAHFQWGFESVARSKPHPRKNSGDPHDHRAPVATQVSANDAHFLTLEPVLVAPAPWTSPCTSSRSTGSSTGWPRPEPGGPSSPNSPSTPRCGLTSNSGWRGAGHQADLGPAGPRLPRRPADAGLSRDHLHLLFVQARGALRAERPRQDRRAGRSTDRTRPCWPPRSAGCQPSCAAR